MAGEIIHGRNAVLEALRAQGRVNRVYIVREGKVASRDDILDAARAAGVAFEFVPLAKMNTLTGVSEHQGCAAAITPVAYAELHDVLAGLEPRALILVLDQVQHPRNVGMLLRTAAGAGAAAVLLPQRGGALLDADIVRASAGAVLHVPVVACPNLAQSLRVLKDHNFWVYGLDAEARDSVFTCRWADRCALVAGSETKGMRPGTAKLCDAMLSIPLSNGLDSLNVAVSAGIAMYQARYGKG
jgi:23S rRNA (guanosine2251-2'-O)-methyltransferase